MHISPTEPISNIEKDLEEPELDMEVEGPRLEGENDEINENKKIKSSVKEEKKAPSRKPITLKETKSSKNMYIIIGTVAVVVILLLTSIIGTVILMLGGGYNYNITDDDDEPEISPTLDTDKDGVPDIEDAFPNNPSEWKDTDGDGVGNNEDNDDDNDGVLDAIEELLGTNSTDVTDLPSEEELEDLPEISNEDTVEYDEGIIVYDASGKNYIEDVDRNVGYFIPFQNGTRSNDLCYQNLTEVFVPEGFPSSLIGNFLLLTNENGTELIDTATPVPTRLFIIF